MPVYTFFTAEKKRGQYQQKFKSLFCSWENAPNLLKIRAQENGQLDLSGQMKLHSAHNRRKEINGDHKQNTIQ